MSTRWLIGLALPLTLLSSACSDDSAGPDPDDNDDGDAVACPDLAFAASSAQPLQRIAIGRVPFTLVDPLFANVSASGVVEPAIVFVERAENGDASIITPIHPSGSMTGGPVEISITDGAHACPAVGFQVESLPPAHGELADIDDLLQELVALQADLAGTTVDALRQADQAGIAEFLIPLAVVQSVLDRPDNPNSLRAIVDGSAPFLAGASLDGIERVMATTGLRAALEATLAEAAAEAAAEHIGVRRGASGTMPATSAGNGSLASSGIDAIDVATCLTDPVDTPSLLDRCMSLANSATFQLSHATGQTLKDIGFAWSVAGLFLCPPFSSRVQSPVW